MWFVSFSIFVWVACIKFPAAFSIGIWGMCFIIWHELIIIQVSDQHLIAPLHHLTMMQRSKKTVQIYISNALCLFKKNLNLKISISPLDASL